MTERTCVWIQSPVLLQALGRQDEIVKTSKRRNESENFTWTKCLVLSGDISSLQEAGKHNLTVQVQDDESSLNKTTVELSEIVAGSIEMANEWAAADVTTDAANKLPEDLITLSHLHEPSVVYCLRKRYERDLIYTDTGPILIALNPFKALPGLYEDDTMSEYWARGEGHSDNRLKPHVYANADSAFRKMMRGIEMRNISVSTKSSSAAAIVSDQSILVSGESGAGKTVTTKHIMKYLATLSQRKADHAKRRRAPSPGRGENSAPMRAHAPSTRRVSRRLSRNPSWKAGAQIEEKILNSNPILESFGNARTIRNDNSSRFGKFVELQFKQTGSLIGASIETYLLEKVRLIHQMPGERNFHVFYESLSAATQDERDQYHLGDYTVEDFKMTSASGTYDRRDGEDDAELFDSLIMAMSTMGFEPKTQEDIFRVTMAFLHASNLTFEAVTDDSSKVDDTNPHLTPVLTLLGLEKDGFEKALCQFEIEAGSTSYTRTLNKELAEKGLEALVKSSYGALFAFIVSTINKKIDFKLPRGTPKTAGKASFIGVLDIFGFESFETNSFEQLCINYCNEALQQQFNLHIFKTEQEEYRREGIAWKDIEFPDNQDVIELIYNRKASTGIIAQLTDQCKTARGSDKMFADSMYKACDAHPRFEATALDKGKGEFVILHYAGPVQYQTEGFVEKNKDEIPRAATTLLENSSNQFVQLLGKISAPPAPASGRRANKRPTVGAQFALQLADLRSRIDKTSPHYIRCLKPNDALVPDDFNNSMIADQLRYAGVLEAIRVSRVGYSQRYPHSVFVDRYQFIALDALRNTTKEEQVDILVNAIAAKIFEAQNPAVQPPSDLLAAVGIQNGRTKVFLRQTAFEYMERFRSEQLGISANKIQSLARRFLARCRYAHIRHYVIASQAFARRVLACKHVQRLREDKACTNIQKTFLGWTCLKAYLARKAIAIWFQRMARGRAGRKHFTKLWNERQQEIAVRNRQYKAAVAMQCMYRSKHARGEVAALKAEQVHQSSHANEQSDAAVVLLKKQQKTAALQADKAQAVAVQTKQDADKEVEELRRELELANIASERDKEMREQVQQVRAELDLVRAQLEAAKLDAETSKARLDHVEEENAKLKAQIKSGIFISGAAYTSTQYDEHEDLRQVDERLYEFALRSRQSKKDVEALVASLAILR